MDISGGMPNPNRIREYGSIRNGSNIADSCFLRPYILMYRRLSGSHPDFMLTTRVFPKGGRTPGIHPTDPLPATGCRPCPAKSLTRLSATTYYHCFTPAETAVGVSNLDRPAGPDRLDRLLVGCGEYGIGRPRWGCTGIAMGPCEWKRGTAPWHSPGPQRAGTAGMYAG